MPAFLTQNTFSLRAMLLFTAIVLGMLLVAAYVFFSYSVETPTVTLQPFPKAPTINSSSLIAQSAIVYDPNTGKILYEKNADVTMPLASLTKLMTAEVVLSNVPTTTLITLSAKDTSVEGDAGDWNLKTGDTMTLSNIIKLGLNASSNHAMSAAAAALGAQYVGDLNRTANQLGLTHTYFLNSTGLDLTATTSGAYGSASDIAHLAAAFMRQYPQYFEQSTAPRVTVPVSYQGTSREVTVDATALPLLDLPGIIGAKTGYTDLAGGNLVVAFDADVNYPLIAVVLGSSEDGRFSDMRTLINATREAQN